MEAQLRSELARVPGLDVAYLFGSFARGTAGPSSDIDLALLFARPPASTLEGQPYGLEADLTERFGRPVQIVVLNNAPVDLVERILREGRIVLENSRSHRIQFEVRTRNERWDLQPFVQEYRRART